VATVDRDQPRFAPRYASQTYLGKPVLTWFQGSGIGGEDVIYNARYQQIATVKPANGYLSDFHEFLITPWNTALILADTIGTANLTSLGVSAHQQVMDGVVQGCHTSPSSARQESCCSTPSSPTARAPTAPTGCRGIRAAKLVCELAVKNLDTRQHDELRSGTRPCAEADVHRKDCDA
jgi:hypothetical protein